MKNHSILLFLFAVLAPFYQNIPVYLKPHLSATGIITGGLTTDIFNDLGHPYLKRQSDIEMRLRKDMKFLEDLLIMYLVSIDEVNENQDELLSHRFNTAFM